MEWDFSKQWILYQWLDISIGIIFFTYNSKSEITFVLTKYVFTQPIHYENFVIQSQFLREVTLVRILYFPSSWLLI